MPSPLFSQANVTQSPIGEGDAGVVLKPDGTFQVFNTWVGLDPDALTETQRQQGQQLRALAAVLKVPQLFDICIQVANDPEIFDQAKPVELTATH